MRALRFLQTAFPCYLQKSPLHSVLHRSDHHTNGSVFYPPHKVCLLYAHISQPFLPVRAKGQDYEKVFKLVIEAPLIAKSRKAGHFVIVRVGEKGERMPLTIAAADPVKGTMDGPGGFENA